MALTQTRLTPVEAWPAPSGEAIQSLARHIMQQVMPFRRMAGSDKGCAASTCESCLAPHLGQVMSAIAANRPILFVLPAFPAKSPNPAKVLGTLPDRAEQLSLAFLDGLCRQIQTLYSPGAQVILCSDGRVFNDVVGIPDEDVTRYQHELARLIEAGSYMTLSTFNLDDLYANQSFTRMRQHLMMHEGESLETLKAAIRRGSKASCCSEDEEIHRQYCGITRFLVDDATRPEQTQSRNALQKACRQRAYVVIQRSRAWSALIAKHFPHALRLSIHPQSCGTAKMGIRLIDAENWMTPWHGVALAIGPRFILIKRAQAEALGARLVYREGRASHYELINALEGGCHDV